VSDSPPGPGPLLRPGPLLVTGGSGYLGRAIVRSAEPPVIATHFKSSPPAAPAFEWVRLDVRDASAMERLFERVRPGAVVHTAYLPEGPDAWETNAAGSANVARAAGAAGARLVHVSTDLVFDGTARRGYTEDDEPRPIGDYGRSKLEAERAVLAVHPGALVVRTSLMVGGAEPSRQELAVLAVARGESDMAFFEDERRSPLLVDDLAAALVELTGREEAGVLHVGGPEAVSRYELACAIARAHGLPTERLRRGRVAGSGLDRPENCVLDSTRARMLLRTPIRGVSELPQVAGEQPRPH
jgi:dTDP-4-dehydrorhamnose reductase